MRRDTRTRTVQVEGTNINEVLCIHYESGIE